MRIRSFLDIRLIGSRNGNEGRLEVYSRNRWKSVCDQHWSYNLGNVVCRELGFSTGNNIENTKVITKKSRCPDIDVRCNGIEKRLSECFIEKHENGSCICKSVELKCHGKEGGRLLFFLVTFK